MKYYKYLNLNFEPAALKLKDYIYKHSDNFLVNQHNSSWKSVNIIDVINNVPELLSMIKPLNLTIKYGAFFVSSYSSGTIHIDHDVNSKCRIIIPVLNCENTQTKFFTTTDEPVKVLQDNGIPLLKLDPSKCTWADEYHLTKAVIFRNDQPHQVTSNNLNTPRISFTIGFVEDIEHLFNE